MDEQRLGRRLQAARLHAGLTQQALCQKAQLSYSTLTKIERGAIKSPSIFTIQSIASALGVGLDELMGGATHHPLKHYSKTGISFVYFDINGCLVRFFHRAFTRLSEVTGASPDTVESTFWHYNDLVCQGSISLDEFNRILSSELNAKNQLDWKAYYMETIEPIAAMHDLVHWVEKQYHIGLLTNIMPGFVEIMLKKGLLPKADYDSIIDSSVVKLIKPESKIYTLATERAGVPGSEILLIDDSRVNLMAAEKHDWHVLWFDDYRPEESIKRIKQALEPTA